MAPGMNARTCRPGVVSACRHPAASGTPGWDRMLDALQRRELGKTEASLGTPNSYAGEFHGVVLQRYCQP